MVGRGYNYKILVILLVEWLYDNANVGKVVNSPLFSAFCAVNTNEF
jgi:hypothetical protein